MFPFVSDGIAYGDYYLLGRLGSGGMAEVFLGKRLGDGVGGDLLTVKRLLTQFSGDPELVKTFQDEARLGQLLHHPNIVEVLEGGDHSKQQFIVLEFIHGKDLKAVQQRARKGGARVPYIASAYIAAAIADALAYAHELEAPDSDGKTIVHRDLAPQKIIISYEGVPKLIDFSARDAKSRGIEGRLGSLKGRFGYMSPEQATSSPAGPRSDIFSLGIILYELTTGMAPFRGGSDAATVGKVARASYSPPELVNASIPRGLAKVIEHAMQRDPGKRYATADEMAQALREFIREDGQVIDKGELARVMRELFFEDYERERVRVEQYRRLTPMSTTASGSKPVPMGDSLSSSEGSRTSNDDDRTTADDRSLASIDEDDFTGPRDAVQDMGDDEGTDTGIGIPDTGIHHTNTEGDRPDSGLHVAAADSGVHDRPDTGRHEPTDSGRQEPTDTGRQEPTDTGRREPTDAGLDSAPEATEGDDDAKADDHRSTEEIPVLAPADESVAAASSSPFIEETGEQLARLTFESTVPLSASPLADTPVASPALQADKPGDFNITLEEVMPKLDDEPTGADAPVKPVAVADEATSGDANPWATDQAVRTTTFTPPAVLGEGPTVVAATFFAQQGIANPFLERSPQANGAFDEKTKVYEGVADLVRRTQPYGYGVEVAKPDKPPVAPAASGEHPAQLGEVIDAMYPLAVATTVQVMHVATVIGMAPEKAVTEVVIADPLPKAKKKKKSRSFFARDEDDEEIEELPAPEKQEPESEFLDDEVFAKSGPIGDIDMDAPRTTASAMPAAAAAFLHEQPEDLDEYEEVGRFFSRSDMITLVVAAFMGMLIMTASYVYALNVPLPDQDTIVDER